MKKVISNNLKNILAGSIIAGSLVGLQSCDETQNAEDLGKIIQAIDGELHGLFDGK